MGLKCGGDTWDPAPVIRVERQLRLYTGAFRLDLGGGIHLVAAG